MARETKPGIQYFSHDVDMLQDKRIKIIKAKHGLIGYAIYIRLLEEAYRENGYYLHIDEDFNILFSDDNNIDYDVYILILNDCIEKGLFNKKIFDNYSIITSKRMQTNYYDATERRKTVTIVENYIVVQPSERYTEKVDVNIETLNANIEVLNADISTQSKVNKSKVNKSILNNTSLVVEFYKTLLLPKFNKLTDKRKKTINARLNDYNLETVKDVLQKANDSNFLKDSLSSNWYNFDWLFNPNNFIKILEDKYNNGGGSNGPNQGHQNGPDYDAEPEGYEGLGC